MEHPYKIHERDTVIVSLFYWLVVGLRKIMYHTRRTLNSIEEDVKL